ncbi:MAG: LuxR family transcriptional regulator [Alphaproteobacteria bacterium]|nr:LuxR family transcriptional regulator [Alphaproteobacteria bacterium]
MASSKPVSQTLERFALRLRAAESFELLRDIVVSFLDAEGVAMASYHHLPPPGAKDYAPTISVAAHGFPEDWLRAYRDQRYYEIDPIPRRVLDLGLPFWWSEAREMPGLSAAEKDFLNELERAGFGDGLAIAVFGPHGRNGYVGLGCGVGNGPKWSAEKVARLQIAAQAGHQQYCHLLAAKAPAGVSLSDREQQILGWMARGRSNAAIAETVGISPNTVDTYVRRIYEKLDVTDRVTASLRGHALGLID